MEKPDTKPALAPEDDEQGMLSLGTLLTTLRRRWYLVALCAAAGGALAWYYAGCQKFTYQKTASVMMKDARQQQDVASTRILTELGVDSGAANLANESIILKSTSLMQSVVEELALNTGYWAQQRFREVELYDESPLIATFSGLPEQRACEISATPTGEGGYTLSYENSAGETVSLSGTYGEPLQLPFATVTIRPTSSMGAEWAGRAVTIRREPAVAATRALLASLKVTRPDEKDASLLEMTLTTHNPRKAADVLNHLIEAYNRQSLAERRESARKTQEFITTRVAEIGQALGEVDSRIVDIKAQGDIVMDADTALTADFSAAQALEKEIFELNTQIKLAATLAGQLEAAQAKDGLISIDTGLADATLSGKLEAYNEAYLEYQKVSVSAGSKNPIVVTLRDRMASTLKAARTALANYRDNQQLRLRELEEKKAEHERRLADTASRGQALSPLVREHKVKEELYMLLLAKEQENSLALYIAEPSARALETAYGPDHPLSPNTAMFTAAGAAGGGALCLLAIIGLGMLNNKVRDKHDVEGSSRIPAVGELPRLTRKEKKGGIFVRGSHSTMAECLHILRNNVDHLLPRKEAGGPLILITSTMPGEGKTFITANLAAAYAHAGRRVLIIDGDLRKGSLTRELGAKGRRGLSSLLLRHVADARELIHPLEGASQGSGRVDIMAAGSLPPNPVTLLSQPALGELLGELCTQYDAVILDAPPYGILADTDLLAQHADLTLYIIRSERIDRRYLAQIQKLADGGKLPAPAFVINDVDFKASSYNYYGYGYGYYRYGYSAKGKKVAAEAGKNGTEA